MGYRAACPLLIKGLYRLEYRGYDSAGLAWLDQGLHVFKTQGKVEDLEAGLRGKTLEGTIGMAHTRWATHGEPNEANAHPHLGPGGKLALIHNGIIENHHILKQELMNRGHVFRSETDTEVLVHLIEAIRDEEQVDLTEATRMALNQVVGAYAIVLLSADEPDRLIAAKKGSPMVIGLGKQEYFIASDAAPIVEHARDVVYLNDGEMAIISRAEGLQVKTITNQDKTPYVQRLEMQLSTIEKGGFPHFMLKEIHEQPRSILDSMRGRLKAAEGQVMLGGIQDYMEKLLRARRIIMLGCGTSWHAGLVGEYLFEDLARIPVEVEYASEFRYRNPILHEDDVVLAISQSGETADTLAAIELARSKGATILGICNVVGSSIARVTHSGSYTHAGPEIGVASTKAFTAQVTVLTLMALSLAARRGTLDRSRYVQLLNQLEAMPAKVEELIARDGDILTLARKFKDARNFLYLGRGYNFPVALEGALKMKEISYIHAEGYPAAEMKHGPIALIDEDMPVVVLATRKGAYDKVLSNIQEIKARKGVVIAVVTRGDEQVRHLADHLIEVPEADEMFMPLLAVIPLQLLAYHVAVLRGCDVDRPRNLAKSVTVE